VAPEPQIVRPAAFEPQCRSHKSLGQQGQRIVGLEWSRLALADVDVADAAANPGHVTENLAMVPPSASWSKIN
jgi:hypothetical protein